MSIATELSQLKTEEDIRPPRALWWMHRSRAQRVTDDLATSLALLREPEHGNVHDTTNEGKFSSSGPAEIFSYTAARERLIAFKAPLEFEVKFLTRLQSLLLTIILIFLYCAGTADSAPLPDEGPGAKECLRR